MHSPFQSAVFAGGGSRCLWQCGFWAEAAPRLDLAPRVFAGASAGATMAAAIIAGRAEFALDYMKRATGANRSNAYPLRLFTAKRVFPHWEIYRSALLATLDETGFRRIRTGPELRVVLSQPPRWTQGVAAALLGFSCYVLEGYFSPGVHPGWAEKAGFRPLVVSARDCATPEELADLLLASSCAPPLLPIMRREGRTVLDGGLVDNVPARAVGPEAGPMLILLSKPYPAASLPDVPGRVYVQPSGPVGVAKWDYTRPQGLQAAYDLGRRDGERFAGAFRRPE